MKKMSLILALIMVFSCFAFTACSKQEATKDNEATKFIVGFDADFPPYGYQEDGEYKGFDLDLAKEVCKRNGWEFVAQPIDWDSKDHELNAGTISCLWNGFTINGREDDYTWSDPYVDNTQVMVVKKDSGITKLSDLAGKTVSVQAASSAESVLKDEEGQKNLADTFKELIAEREYNTCFANLEAGAVDAVAMDIGVAKYQIESRGADKYVMLEEDLSTEKYGVGFKKGNTELRDQVQKTLDEMMADGTFQKIAKDWGLTDSVIIKEAK